MIVVALAAAVAPPIRLEAPAAGQGPPGTADPSFDSDGVAITELRSNVDDFAMDAVRLPDGKVLILAGDGPERLVWRVHGEGEATSGAQDGTLDTTFDLDGVLDPASSDLLFANSIALRPGGGFVLAGSIFDASCPEGAGVARFDASGVIDRTFGTLPAGVGGIVCMEIAGDFGVVADIAVDASDRVLVLGSVRPDPNQSRISLTRLTAATGAVETTVSIPEVAAAFEDGDELAIQPDGKIVVAGHATEILGVGTNEVIVARFNPTPLALDDGFGDSGGIFEGFSLDTSPRDVNLVVRTFDESPEPEALEMAIAFVSFDVPADDVDPDVPQIEIYQLDQGGSFVDSPLCYGATCDIDLDDSITSLSIGDLVAKDLDADNPGYMVVGSAAFADSAREPEMIVIDVLRGFSELEADLFASPVPANGLSPGAAVQLPSGQPLVVGITGTMLGSLGPFPGPMILNRLNEEFDPGPPPEALGARIDPTFDDGHPVDRGGFVLHNGLTEDVGMAVAVQFDGRVVVGGASGFGGFILRYLADGSLDPDFGTGGVTFVGFNVHGVALAPGGAVVAAGVDFFEGGSVGVVQRLLSDGQPDDTWNGGDPLAVGGDFLRGIAVDASGRVVVAGDQFGAIVVARLLDDGSPDPDFGDAGIALIESGGGTAFGRGPAIELDGDIVVAGQLDDQLAIARLDSDGVLDGSLDGDGVVLEDGSLANAVGVRPDGRIVVAGARFVSGSPSEDTRAFVAQFLPSGGRDLSFGTNGATDITSTEVSAATGLAIDAAGRPVVGGFACRGPVVVPATSCGGLPSPAGSDILLARLTTSGDLDPDFGSGGVTFTDLAAHELALGLDLTPDGRVVVAGVNQDTRGSRIVAARYDAAGVAQQLDCGALAVDAATSGGAPVHTPAPSALRRAGDPDTTFNGTGVAISELSSDFDDAVDAAAHGNGLLVLDDNGRVWRFLGDGTLDESFAAGGVLDVSDAVVDPVLGLDAEAIAARADGTFAVGGRVFGDDFGNPNGRFVGAASFLADGTLEWFTPVANDGFDITAVTDPADGTALANADGTVSYTPDAGFTGIDSFTYTITDRTGLTDTATVNVRVGGDASFPPLTNDDTFQMFEGTSSITRNVVENDLTDTPLGNPNNLDIVAISDPPNGTATQPFLGWIQYTPDPGFTGLETFTYTVEDDEGQTAIGTVRVFVRGGNTLSAPVAADNAASAEPATPSTVQVLFNDLASASLGFVGFGDVDAAVRSDGSVVLAGTGDLTTGGEQLDAITLGAISRDGGTVFLAGEAPFPPTPGFISAFLSTDSVAVQSDDKVVVTGHVNLDDVFVARWLANLSGLDKSFSGDGVDVLAELNASSAPVAIQPNDGTIAVATDWGDDPEVWFLWRWDDETGTLQTTNSVAFGAEVDGAEPVALVTAPDGGLLVTGTAIDFDSVQPDTVAAARFTPEGVLATPAPNLFPVGGGDTFAGAAVAFPDRFVVVGTTREDVDAEPIILNRLVLLGLTTDAALDPTFGSNGCFPHRAPRDEAAAVAVALDGSIYAGGTLDTGFDFDSDSAGVESAGPGTADSSGSGGGGFVVRHTPGGPIDTTFHAAGLPGAQVLPYPDADDLDGFMHVHDLAVAPDGKVVAVGHDTDNFDEPAVVVRLLPGGGVDPAFNEGEPVVLFPQFDLGRELRGVAVGADGAIVAVGTRDPDINGDDPGEIFVVRLLPDGTPDPDFGPDGDGTAPVFTGESAMARAIAVQPNGRLVVTGTAGPSPNVAVVARLLSTGALDRTFGTGGVVLDNVGFGADEGRGVAVRPDGRIVVAGVNDAEGTPNLFVTQYRGDGSRDLLFGTGGEFVTSLGFGEAVVNDVVLDAVGNAVTVGSVAASPGADRDVLLFRVRPAGDRDPAFGANGVRSDLGGDDTAAGVALGPDGAITVAGTTVGGRGGRLFVSRYDAGATLRCTPSPVTFGPALVGTSSAGSRITCTNVGPGSLAMSGVSISGLNPADFAVTANGCANATLRPGASCPITVVSRPTVIGDRRATLIATHTGTERVDFVFLQGRGDAGTFSAAPNPLDFGEVRALVTSPSQRVTVTNTGPLAMTVSSVSVVGAQAAEFAIVATNCNVVVIGPGGSCTVDVTFTPAGADPAVRQAGLQFVDDTPGTPHTVALQGTVAEPTLIASPGVGQRGQVVEIIGANFPAGQEVTVVWTDPLVGFSTFGFPEQPLTTTVSANGTFSLQMPTFRRTPTGTRFARATAGVFTADAPFLVTLPTGTPLEFISRG